MAKRCTKCGGAGPFNRDKNRTDGLHPWCRPCTTKYSRGHFKKPAVRKKCGDRRKVWAAENPVKQKTNARRKRLRRYGMTLESFENLFSKQEGKCAICGDLLLRSKKRGVCVDHCHATGEVRGLLCWSCNIGLGHFHDDPVRLEGAVLYLKKNVVGGALPVV
jgi:hypothetical protein